MLSMLSKGALGCKQMLIPLRFGRNFSQKMQIEQIVNAFVDSFRCCERIKLPSVIFIGLKHKHTL